MCIFSMFNLLVVLQQSSEDRPFESREQRANFFFPFQMKLDLMKHILKYKISQEIRSDSRDQIFK